MRFVDGACNGQLIITAGILGVVSCWRLENTAQVCVMFAICVYCVAMTICVLPQSVSYTGEVVHLRGHNGPVTSLCVCRPFGIVVSGSEDRTAIIWDTNRLASFWTVNEDVWFPHWLVPPPHTHLTSPHLTSPHLTSPHSEVIAIVSFVYHLLPRKTVICGFTGGTRR